MYKVSVWLKGGGKIVEECDITEEEVRSLQNNFLHPPVYDASIQINRKTDDPFPIILSKYEIAATQIDEKYVPENSSHTRKLETRV